MGGLGFAAHLLVVGKRNPIEFPGGASWWVPAVLFGLFELASKNTQIQSDSHSLSVTEISIVIGVVLGPPVALIVGRMVGSAVAAGRYPPGHIPQEERRKCDSGQ